MTRPINLDMMTPEETAAIATHALEELPTDAALDVVLDWLDSEGLLEELREHIDDRIEQSTGGAP